MKVLTRNIIAWLQEFLPMWQMKVHLTYSDGRIRDFDVNDGAHWWLPEIKKRVKLWNEEAAACHTNPKENFAYHVRLK